MTATGLACDACGIALPENAKFCLECGAALSMAAKPAEYEQVTVSAKIACFDQSVRSRATAFTGAGLAGEAGFGEGRIS
ncbi:MAG: hypothetical protein QOJ56_3597 [Mycobacterium sp.]|jgi:hypothetical protein|nr:hypothetical protein [Mycobacterium sp.]